MTALKVLIVSLIVANLAHGNNPMPMPPVPDCATYGNCGGGSSGVLTWEGILYAVGPILFFYLAYLYGKTDRGMGIKRKPEPKQTRQEKKIEQNELETIVSELLRDAETFDELRNLGWHPSWNTVPNWYHKRLNSADESESKRSREYLNQYRRYQELCEKYGKADVERIIERERTKSVEGGD